MEDGAGSYRRFLDGDESAFEELIELYFGPLTLFANRYTQNIHDAEDIAMDTLTELLIHRHRYRFGTSLRAYLFAIARNKSLNFLRHRDKFRCVSADDAEADLADRRSLEDELIADERKRALNDALATLSEDMRTAVHLVYFEDMTYQEASKVMKKTEKQIDNLLYRAKNALRVKLEKGGFSL